MLWLLGWSLAQEELKPWFQAAAKGDVKELAALLAAGQDINAKTVLNDADARISGANALMYATSSGRVAAVRYLLEKEASPYMTDYSGNTALHMVADTTDSAELAQMLISAGALTTARNNHDYEPFISAEVNQLASVSRPGYTPRELASYAAAAATSITAVLNEYETAQTAMG